MFWCKVATPFCSAVSALGALLRCQVAPPFSPAAALAPTIFSALSGPMALMMALHRIAGSAPVENIDAVTGIVETVIPAAAKSDIGIAITIVAGIIIIKWCVGIAAITHTVHIAVTI
ncbi:MAG: hypothetical protein Pars92KO_19680 [Parasphingorhabdus sp.]